jgi:hypothetical protein
LLTILSPSPLASPLGFRAFSFSHLLLPSLFSSFLSSPYSRPPCFDIVPEFKELAHPPPIISLITHLASETLSFISSINNIAGTTPQKKTKKTSQHVY